MIALVVVNPTTILSRPERPLQENVVEIQIMVFVPHYTCFLKNLELFNLQSKNCDEKDGWCPRGTIEKCRDLMTEHTERLLNISSSNLEPGEYGMYNTYQAQT